MWIERTVIQSACLWFDPLSAVIYLGSAVSALRCEGRGARLLPFMDKKRIVASLVVFCILAALFYLQYKHWQSFDWGTFWAQIHRIKKVHVLHGIALVYAAYVLRALRWKMFLKPVRPKVRVISLVPPMVIGFTGLALLGRAASLSVRIWWRGALNFRFPRNWRCGRWSAPSMWAHSRC